jgi:hypothetical protein
MSYLNSNEFRDQHALAAAQPMEGMGRPTETGGHR